MHLHCSPFSNKVWRHLVFQVVYLLLEVPLWSTRLKAIPLAERNPFLCKFRCFRQCFKCKHCSTIIRNIAGDLLNRIIHGKDGKDSVRCDQGRFLRGINRTDKEVNRSKLRGLTFLVEPGQRNNERLSFGILERK